MNVKDLQKLDFLLKKANIHSHNIVEYKIVFGMHGQVYTGDFIPKIEGKQVKLPDVFTYGNDSEIPVSIKNEQEWSQIAQTENQIFEDSDLYKMINRSDNDNPFRYFFLVDELLEKYPIEFDTHIPSYLYNPKNLSNEFPIEIKIMKLSDELDIEFLTIVPSSKI
ncbi:hypothetical protein [Staphylococcus kloosii]|uniref:hypothetical protein n=1 Tax=Staphylococcus kloosii TaxID=29384 RepID=UPI001E53DB62|nr:hypothetical protein [Staphylococcus kloosii]MCD8878098.1 hypothetical protein [Staphylococcus kloosii]